MGVCGSGTGKAVIVSNNPKQSFNLVCTLFTFKYQSSTSSCIIKVANFLMILSISVMGRKPPKVYTKTCSKSFYSEIILLSKYYSIISNWPDPYQRVLVLEEFLNDVFVISGSLDSEAGIYALSYDMTGSRLVTCEADKTIKMWKEDENATPETHPVNFKPPKDIRRF